MKRIIGKKGRIIGRTVDQTILSQIQILLGEEKYKRELLIEYLHEIQDHYHHISNDHIRALAHAMNISSAEIYETATFYHHFDVIKKDMPPPPPLTVRICNSITCEMFGANQLINTLIPHVDQQQIRIQAVPCVGRCAEAPIAVIGSHPVEYADKNKVIQCIQDNNQTATPPKQAILYEEYVNQGGYQQLQKCHSGEHQQDDIIALIKEANLRGLGGAGFSTGQKWHILKDAPKPKYIAINIDEGEPGTFKDRYYLERDPHRFIEGTLIASWAIESEDIYIYLRDEYAGCRLLLNEELEKLKSAPFINNIPKIHIRRGAGAYICGEESAMIESIEGKRGMPRLRPPYVAQVGLFNRPTLEQNMETMHWIRELIEKGPQWFKNHGRQDRTGLRTFSVSGRVNKPGVHIAPAGISVLELIEEYCDGMLAGHEFYGYFPGGASGGILPASLGNLPLDFDTLQEYGCFIGSAAIIILSQQDSVKAMALNAMRFFEDESCGQCTPCRVGTTKAIKLMKQKDWDVELLEELSQVMVDASICGLGQAAPNPMLCAIKYFPEEFK